MTAFCGLICSECVAFIATQNDDDEKRVEVAQLWSQQYNVDMKLADINCDGCIVDNGRHIGHCNVCEKLEEFFRMAPDAQKHLDAIRSEL